MFLDPVNLMATDSLPHRGLWVVYVMILAWTVMSLISTGTSKRAGHTRAAQGLDGTPVGSTGEVTGAAHRGNPQRTLAEDLVKTIGIVAALSFARERQWYGVVNQIRTTWLADPGT